MKKQIHTFTTPTALSELVNKFDQATAARKIGLSPAAVSVALKENKCKLVTELAAKQVLQGCATPTKDELMMVRVPNAKVDMCLAFFKGAEIKVARFKE